MIPDKEKLYTSIENIVRKLGSSESSVIPVLHAIQKEFHYLPPEALKKVCEISDISPASITGVSTFYSQFRLDPVGEHMISVCNGTACHVKGSEQVFDAFRRELKIDKNRDTDTGNLFTVQKVACLGCCTLAPVVQIDDTAYGYVKGNKVASVLQDFVSSRGKAIDRNITGEEPAVRNGEEIRIALDSCCIAGGTGKLQQEVVNCLSETGINAQIKHVGCVGMCHRIPLLELVLPNNETVIYEKVRPEEVRNILLRHFKPGSPKKRLVNSVTGYLGEILDRDNSEEICRKFVDPRDPCVESFNDKQVRIATEHFGCTDPLDIGEYLSRDGFRGMKECLREFSPEKVIEIITASGLRGRGGAGFPTGQKWDIVRKSQSSEKYIICNGDEGDPGAFMDRMILESYPFRVIEGIVIAAFAVGAKKGYMYIRAEYPVAVERVKKALVQCRENNLLGENILGSGFSLDLEIMEGAGAFVCGEETALIASIEGKRGNPHFRPPYPAQKGLWGHPTLVNNCETYACVPWVIRNGASGFDGLGTGSSRGTKVFSLAGRVLRGGLIEVPMGITIREIVEDIGGGVEEGRNFKAVQIGGPSGGCIPYSLADTKIDFDELTVAGAMMGSGGLLVMDENDCMVDIARYFLAFTSDQSCGKCTWCRIGVRQMLNLLDKICEGRGNLQDLEKLEEIAEKTKLGSLCGLGKTAPNPVLTTLQYFRGEYEAHLEGRCPAKRCPELITYTIKDDCIGCTICAQKCPVKAIEMVPYEKHQIQQELCIKCGTCKQVCPSGSVIIE